MAPFLFKKVKNNLLNACIVNYNSLSLYHIKSINNLNFTTMKNKNEKFAFWVTYEYLYEANTEVGSALVVIENPDFTSNDNFRNQIYSALPVESTVPLQQILTVSRLS